MIGTGACCAVIEISVCLAVTASTHAILTLEVANCAAVDRQWADAAQSLLYVLPRSLYLSPLIALSQATNALRLE